MSLSDKDHEKSVEKVIDVLRFLHPDDALEVLEEAKSLFESAQAAYRKVLGI